MCELMAFKGYLDEWNKSGDKKSINYNCVIFDGHWACEQKDFPCYLYFDTYSRLIEGTKFNSDIFKSIYQFCNIYNFLKRINKEKGNVNFEDLEIGDVFKYGNRKYEYVKISEDRFANTDDIDGCIFNNDSVAPYRKNDEAIIKLNKKVKFVRVEG